MLLIYWVSPLVFQNTCLHHIKIHNIYQLRERELKNVWIHIFFNRRAQKTKRSLLSFHLITCISGLFITDATFLQHRECMETRQQSLNSSLLFPLYQSLIYLSQDNPHSSYELCYLCETDWIWSSGGGMRLRKWAMAEACKGKKIERHSHKQ